MVKHNNVVPNQHFKKKWQFYVKTWFNQPARKVRRRNGKASAFDYWLWCLFLALQAGRPSRRSGRGRWRSRQRRGRSVQQRQLWVLACAARFQHQHSSIGSLQLDHLHCTRSPGICVRRGAAEQHRS